jgi:hypothetical protein
MPWFFKIPIKILLSYFPRLYPVIKKLKLSQLGQMDTTSYAHHIFKIHTSRSFPDGFPPDLCVLELGPGDSIATAILGSAYRIQKTYLVDASAFASQDLKLYRRMSAIWKENGLDVPDISGQKTIDGILDICRGIYLTNGLESLKGISDHSIDFSWSHSVLEHIRKREFLATFIELKRITKPGGLSSHIVDLQDHLDHNLNNLRFTETLWEADWFARGTFYTNRIRAQEMLDLITQAGFKILQTDRGYWPKIPLPREKMNSLFQDLPELELRTRTLSVLIQA